MFFDPGSGFLGLLFLRYRSQDEYGVHSKTAAAGAEKTEEKKSYRIYLLKWKGPRGELGGGWEAVNL